MKKTWRFMIISVLVLSFSITKISLISAEKIDEEATDNLIDREDKNIDNLNQDFLKQEADKEEHSLDDLSLEMLEEEAQSLKDIDLEIEDSKHTMDHEESMNSESSELDTFSEEVIDINDIKSTEELKAAIDASEDGDILKLSPNFISDDIIFNLKNKSISIEGNNIEWDKGSISVTGSGSLDLKNMKMNGEHRIKRLLISDMTSGILNLINMEFYNSNGGALHFSTNSNTQVNIIDTTIKNNIAGSGPALFLGSNANVTITNSTISNNEGNGAGYEAGAIASKNYSGNLEIKNSKLNNNYNKAIAPGPVGGGGGAMSIHYFSGHISIVDSILEENRTNGDDGTRSSTYDGGAVYILNMQKQAQLNIEGSSFINNLAYDDGGALLIQTVGSGNGDTVENINILNNTFFGNKALGVDTAAYAGGAIQIYANVGFTGTLHTKAMIKNNTFVNNTVGGIAETDGKASGAALGLSMMSFRSTMKVSLHNNLFAGNVALDSTGETIEGNNVISLESYIENKDYATTNIGAASLNPTLEFKDIFGVYSIILSSNYSNVRAGVDREVVKTVAPKPQGLAENKTSNKVKGLDQRDFESYKDFGSIEITWFKYDANGGVFNLDSLNQYDGTVYYENNEGNEVTTYYTVGYINYEDTIKGEDTLNIQKEGFQFIGWADEPNASEINPEYSIGAKILHEEQNKTIYAVWEELKKDYTIRYTDGVASEELFEDQVYTVQEGSQTPEFIGTPTRNGYTFKGWNPTLSETVTGDQVYEALWEINQYTITYDANGGNEIDPETVDYNELFSRPLNPSKEGYTFVSWYIDADLTEVYDFNKLATEDITVYAKWVKTQKPIEPNVPKDPNTSVNTHQTFIMMILTMLMSVFALILLIRIPRIKKQSKL